MTTAELMHTTHGLEYEVESRMSSKSIAYKLIRSLERRAEKPWIMFCHGISLNGDCWVDWHEHLVSEFNLLVFDVPGYGQSPITADALAKRRVVTDWSEYLVSLMDEVEVPVAYLVGEHSGGATSLYTALTRPERVRACAVISTPFSGNAFAPFRDEYTARSHTDGITGWSDVVLPAIMHGDETNPLRDKFRSIHLANNLDVLLRDAETWGAVDLEADLPSLRAPVLILAPGRGAFLPREHSFELEKLLPDATLVLFGARGQMLAFTEASSAAVLTGSFFRRNPLPTADAM